MKNRTKTNGTKPATNGTKPATNGVRPGAADEVKLDPRPRKWDGPFEGPPRPPIGLKIFPDGHFALPKGNPCVGCDHCCRYLALEIDTPRTKRDFDHIRWYLLHKNVAVTADYDGTWFIQFSTTCEWLVDGKCSHYELRPDICREHDPADCERYNLNPADKIVLRNESDLKQFLVDREARLAKRRRREKLAAR